MMHDPRRRARVPALQRRRPARHQLGLARRPERARCSTRAEAARRDGALRAPARRRRPRGGRAGVETGDGAAQRAAAAASCSAADGAVQRGAAAAAAARPAPTSSRTYLDYGYKELTIPPAADGEFALDPARCTSGRAARSMMIALPNPDRSFTCTLFWPCDGPDGFAGLDDPSAVRARFAQRYPDAVPLMPHLEEEFAREPGRLAGHDPLLALGARRPRRRSSATPRTPSCRSTGRA